MYRNMIRKSFAVVVLMIAIGFICQTRICFSAEDIEGKANINTASAAQLALLPGVGDKLATEIINYRTAKGNFKTIEDIKKVSGIEDKKFEKMKNNIAIEGDTTIKSTKKAKGEKEPKQKEGK